MKNELSDGFSIVGSEEFRVQVAAIQHAYDRRRAELQAALADLERQHAEWLSLSSGQKYLRLIIVAARKTQGEAVDVYSTAVKAEMEGLSRMLRDKSEQSLLETHPSLPQGSRCGLTRMVVAAGD